MKTLKVVSPLVLCLLSVFVGAVAGCGAILFRWIIAFIHNIAFLGTFSFAFDTIAHTPASPLGVLIILVPVIGAIGVIFLVKNFAPEAKGHGVPEVMDAIYYNQGNIRPFVAVIKCLASSISIGTGGAVGREGPIAQIGSSLGSTLGQILSIATWQRITLVAAGAGGGIAATFNTPVGGILFAVELMLHEVSVRTLVPVALATATATYVGRLYFGDHPAFFIPKLETFYFIDSNPLIILTYLVLGIVMGFCSWFFIQSIYKTEDFFESFIKGNEYIRHMIGMLLIGILMYLVLYYSGHYYIQGVGYSTIQDILTEQSFAPLFLVFLCLLKILATCVTLGSGGSGGIFSPLLFIGATLGAAYGTLIHLLLPSFSVGAAAFAVAGMAAMVGGATGAALTAIVMIFEMTLDYNVILPVTVTVAVSYGVRKYFSKDSIYTLKLTRRGHHMPEALQANFQYLQPAFLFMRSPIAFLPGAGTIKSFLEALEKNPGTSYFVIEDLKEVLGILSVEAGLRALQTTPENLTYKDVASKNFIWIEHHESLFDVLVRLKSENAEVALVRQGSKASIGPEGILTKLRMESAIEEMTELYK